MGAARVAALVCVLVCAPVAARADDPVPPWAEGIAQADKERAAELLAEGNVLLDQGLHAQAIEVYRRAIGHYDHPAIRYNIAVALISLQQPLEAYDELTRALAYDGRALEPEVLSQARSYEQLLESQIVRVAINCVEPEARVLLDGKELGACPLARTELVLAGPHQLIADKPVSGKKTRADERLELLETVYESFLLRFYAYGVELEIPRERLKVLLFNEHSQYRIFADRLSPSLSSASGFWSSGNNTAVFFDHGTNEEFKQLKEVADSLQKTKAELLRDRGPATAEIRRLADTLSLLVEIEREDSDIEVVSHEITHQMAGNTGLLPRHVQVPRWVHEGLATYFETPNGATWGGVGAVNNSRLKLYRVLAPDREHSNVDFIVGDQIFDFAASHGAVVHGYSQAWGLTHFLMEKHFDKFLSFYRLLGEMPPDLPLSPDNLNQIFDKAFAGTSRSEIDAEWHAYMDTLKTDIELILEND